MLRLRAFAPCLALLLAACSSTVDMARLSTPTPQHELLLAAVGTWEGTMSFEEPGMPPCGAKEVVEPVGAFFTQSTFTCDMPGMAFLGKGFMGYDPECGQFVGTWIDNTSSYVARMCGEMDASGKTLVMHYDSPHMETGKMTPHRFETTWGKDSYTSAMYADGKKLMTITMKRTGGAKK